MDFTNFLLCLFHGTSDSLITKTHLVFFMAPKDFNDDIIICYQLSHFLLNKKRHTISIKNIHRVIPCGCFLFTKLLCTFFQHFADWQMVRTSGFTFAAFYTAEAFTAREL